MIKLSLKGLNGHLIALCLALLLFPACGGYPSAPSMDAPLFAIGPGQWTQADWSGGMGTSTGDQYYGATGLDTSAPGQFTLSMLADWFDPDWSYRRPISIDNTANTNAPTEYQVLVSDVDTASLIAAGEMQADCADIRFARPGGVALAYSIVGDSCGSAATDIWVKVDTIAASVVTTVHMYYGNPAAAAFESEADTFSYSTPTVVGVVADERLAADQLDVISLADGNAISDGTSTLNLNEQATGSFPGAELSVGTTITATDLFFADGNDNGVDMLTPISYAGTLFIHYSNRYKHFYTIYSHWANANVTVYVNGAASWNGTIDQGNYLVVNTGTYNDRTVRIESDIPVYAHHYALNAGQFYDSVVLYPASSDFLFGVPSNYLNVAAGTAGASVSWIKHDGTEPGSPQALGADGRYESAALGAQGTAGGFRVATDQPIGVTQIADSDGGESVTFWPEQETGTRFGANGGAQYIAVVAPQPNTTCTVHNSSGGVPANPEPGFTNPYTGGARDDVNFLYFGDSSVSSAWVASGWMMECDKEVYAYYERDAGAAEPNDEHNLWSYPQMRQFTYPAPTAGAPGAVEGPYAVSGTLTSNVFDSSEAGSEWGALSFVSDDAPNTVVKVRTSDEPDMAGAPAFASCDSLADGADLSASNCATDGDRYVQYSVNLTSGGEATPTFESITINFVTREGPQANAGPDRIVVAGREAMLDGTGSAGYELTYEWAIFEGSGALLNATTAAPTYVSESVGANEDVTVYLTVTDKFGQRSTDQVVMHVLVTARGSDSARTIAANANGTLIYEDAASEQSARIALFTSQAEIILPGDSGRYYIALNSKNQLLIGLPEMNDERGRVYLFAVPVQNLSGVYDLEQVDELDGVIGIEGNSEGDRFGEYLVSADFSGDGMEGVPIGAPNLLDYGVVYAYTSVLDLIGGLVGTMEYPLSSIFAANYLTTIASDVIFGPDNISLNINLTRGDLGTVGLADYAYVVSGTRDLEGALILDSSEIDLRVGTGKSYQSLAMGDVNGDGNADMVLVSDDGNAYVFYGPVAPGPDLTPADADISIAADSTGIGFGRMAVVGDVNGDGLADIVIGAPTYGTDERGAVYIIFGSLTLYNPIYAATSPNVMVVMGGGENQAIGGDLMLADEDGNGVNEIYTVRNGTTVYKIDLSNPIPSSSSGQCSLAEMARAHLALLPGVLMLAFVLLMRLIRRRRMRA